jgi:L-gulonate 3-dehydrogenase
MEQIAIIGTGLIGRAWAMVFARAGHSVRIWDPVPGVSDAALGLIGQSLQDLAEAGLITEAPAVIAARISAAASMEECVAGAAHVQENGPERVEPKRALFAQLDALCGPDVVLASSTSGIPASAFTEGLAGRARCLVAHPVNPPYLVPLVELVGAPWTAPEVVARTRALMARVGLVPVTAMKETQGFVLNRLQAALVAEAFRLVRDGVMLRWRTASRSAASLPLIAASAANIADQFFGWYPRGWDGGFLAHLHSPWGYDEPEILHYSNRQFGPTGADAGHAE